MAAKAAGVEYADLVLWLLSQTLQQKEGATA
jgi:D-alanine-D-alanine ligase